MIDKKELEDLYLKQNLFITEIADKLSVTESLISYWLKKYSIPKRDRTEVLKRASSRGKEARYGNRQEIREEQLHKLYIGERLSARLVGKRLDIGKGAVLRWLKIFGIARNPKEAWQVAREEGRKQPKRRQIKVCSRGDGYLAIRIYPDSPYYSMASKGGYIMLHRLVMAQQLGRPLMPFERVHHRNSIKHDNRPENLLLVLQGHQGKVKCPFCKNEFGIR